MNAQFFVGELKKISFCVPVAIVVATARINECNQVFKILFKETLWLHYPRGIEAEEVVAYSLFGLDE